MICKFAYAVSTIHCFFVFFCVIGNVCSLFKCQCHDVFDGFRQYVCLLQFLSVEQTLIFDVSFSRKVFIYSMSAATIWIIFWIFLFDAGWVVLLFKQDFGTRLLKGIYIICEEVLAKCKKGYWNLKLRILFFECVFECLR